ncbi:TadE family type IV pilus minor pilin [Propionibacteriaceae bacterium G1746]|uniref:TadE family type IV pilus minor pilin n=1 Tax=Aestuariimicrobium sp. G57 TaxID=3418485 RepID=UPI003C2924FE
MTAAPTIPEPALAPEPAATPRPATDAARARGMVTLELAVGLLTTTLVLFGASAVVGLLITQDRAETIAVQAARHAARGDQKKLAAVKAAAPSGASVDLVTRDGWVHATVVVRRSWGAIGPVTLTATAQQPLEPGA